MRLTIAQMLVEPGNKASNLARAECSILDAGDTDVVLLPEALTLGWTHPSALTEADAIPDGPSCRRLRAAAQKRGVFVCAGLVERAGDKIFNAAVLIDPSGQVLIPHRKIHELDIAHPLYARGDRLSVVETPFGRIGVMICADGFAPGQSISRTLALMGARYILSPCAWAVPEEHDNERQPYGQLWVDSYGAVTRDFEVTIAGASNVGPIIAGPWQGRKCIGNSLVIGPGGQELARGPYGENAAAMVRMEI
jgi:predicted amidohydrolase